MKETFRDKAFRQDALDRIDHCNTVIRSYQQQGLRLSLRQLYYQLVSVNVITNEEKSYKGLGGLVSDARLAGLMDWDAIEDRVRVPRQSSEWENVEDLVSSALAAYRLPRWAGQEYYVELWVEKDALAGVLQPIARDFHITLMVNRGYSSQSAMYESAKRFLSACESQGASRGDVVTPVLLYLGDHDPSGEDMVRDVRDRLAMFEAEVDVRKIALTMAQIRRYNPPPNPAKVTDSRAAKYIAAHGSSSWEVDALPPNVLARLVRTELESLLDRSLWDEIVDKEDDDKKRLRTAAKKIVKRASP